jgi:hypothetical protein
MSTFPKVCTPSQGQTETTPGGDGAGGFTPILPSAAPVTSVFPHTNGLGNF